MVGLMLTIIGGTLTIILLKANNQLTVWQVILFLMLLLGVNFLFGKKKIIINRKEDEVIRIISTILFKFKKHIKLNNYSEICIYGGHSSFSSMSEGRAFPVKSTGAIQIGLKKSNYFNILELADFYDHIGPKIFTEALVEHIGWSIPSTMLVAGEEMPLKWK